MSDWAKFKRDEREKKRAAGLVLKQVWIPPHIWPAIKDLSRSAQDEFLSKGAYSTKTTEEHNLALFHETAMSLWYEIGVCAGVTGFMGDKAQEFAAAVAREFLLTYPAKLHIDTDAVSIAKKEMFGDE